MSEAIMLCDWLLCGYLAYVGIILWWQIRRKEDIRSVLGSLFWIVAFSFIHIFYYIVTHEHYIEKETVPFLEISAVVSFALSLVAPFSGSIQKAIADKVESVDPARQIVICAAADIAKITLFTRLVALLFEFPYNNNVLQVNLNTAFMAQLVVFCFIGVVYYLFQRRNHILALVAILSSIAGVAVQQLYYIRGTVVNLNDLMVLNTAAEVSDKVNFSFSASELIEFEILAFVIFVLICTAHMPMQSWLKRALSGVIRFEAIKKVSFFERVHLPKHIAAHITNIAGISANLVVAAVFSSFIGVSLSQESVVAKPYFYFWDMNSTYSEGGVLPELLYQFSIFKIEKPQGYSDQKAQEEIDKAAAVFDASEAGQTYASTKEQFSQVKPSVIAIMNESYSDMSIYQLMRDAGYDGQDIISKNLPDALQTGYVGVNVLGGGTANSEFEFFTGISTSFYNSKFPYVMYDLSPVDSLVKHFKDEGYTTTAIHPYTGTNYNRNIIYPSLGFDTFLDIDDFPEGTEYFRDFISDRATYQMILDTLNSSDSPQFIWDLTVQNHTRYTSGLVSPELMPNYHIDGLSDDENFALNEYLACIAETNRATAELIEQLRYIDKPVVVIFFGDHQSVVSPWINNISADAPDQVMAFGRQYMTPYFVWANYDVVGNDQVGAQQNLALSSLSAEVSSMIGAPLSPYQKAELTLQDRLPYMSAGVLQDREGVWHGTGDAKEAGEAGEAYEELQDMQYLEFASKVN